MLSNLTAQEVKLWLRVKSNELFGPGYPPAVTHFTVGSWTGTYEDWFVFLWYTQGPDMAYVDLMARHGGDSGLRAVGTFH